MSEPIELPENMAAPARVKKITIEPGAHYGIRSDGQFYFFSTVEIMKAATRKWGPKSRRVKALYELLAEMIHAQLP